MSHSLYGVPRRKSTSKSDTPSASNLAFTTTLTSLISKDSEASTRGRPRASKSSKSDIFTHHNKGAQKRAAADLRDDDNAALQQSHQRTQDIGAVDATALHRSKRRMEEKARMYDELKSGVYLAADSDDEEDTMGGGDAYLARLRRKEREGLVDFDRKWAEAERARGDSEGGEDDNNSDDDDENASVVSYEDELGRSRRGTRAEAARATRLKEESGERSNVQERWRPSRPDNLIYGAAVQAEAFNPSDTVASQISYLAARRDRSPTPPGETHYDADAEVRNRGTGFYAFSKDEDVRRQQMEELMNARDETQREREARQERRSERERVKDERRRKIGELRSKRRAEMFLAGLGDVGDWSGDSRVEADV
ncbi:hypothetical protein EYZ11_000602 [Aspergillus tanneri]|uniref:Coiled-coil domain-containing protein 174 n=1 Tax=Aspergillus tanneri TaxID=1220188 RepID=A0A4S3JWN3_9EURO|nr:uncharacterized protein ATNIH1004_007696 [Aspergillus tanneri]KAA8646269.1 hypothetical protein ATNIH1004_007696 [Aspergillus tanneri]THC99904.1 hypothetical protein EYZ11_000602 [Aspergillus tanneri]